ncbi:DNA processing protein [Butyrivibrio sp. ob235]|uniref:DNA-processing protein DprA n=1 Tax=Butyrivibrio sp. ob235 TaxID=1761780 RepID=UPI0008D3DD75|nr:DNA-processing protein DprA [Butyrivibrio sp. ob235]SEL54345.1 DNA processing protein [Butyrivibrio sp. ob235]
MITDNAYAYMLHNVPGLGNKTLMKLLQEFGSCKNIFEADESLLKKIMTVKQSKAFALKRKQWDLEAEYEHLYNTGIDFYHYGSAGYPIRLLDIPDPPFALYCAGKLPDERRPSVSIIGARNSSEYGKFAAKLFGEKLASMGVQIISGMARGIDGISQQAAVYAGGDSYGVLGCGVDICYPEENRSLYDELISSGGVISEYLPGTQPKPQFFPPRNRIISGLSDVVLVIEAREKSGTLITVDMALEQGREVFALPGRICDSLSYGCNSLIRQGANIASSPEDIVDYLKRNLGKNVCKKSAALGGNSSSDKNDFINDSSTFGLNKTQECIFNSLDFYPQTTSVIFEKLLSSGIEISVAQVMNCLVELCIMGIVSQTGTGFYRRG